MRLRRTFLLSILVLFCFSAWGQISSSTGAVSGAITDPQGAAIAGAKLVLTNTLTAVSTEGASQADGTFVFPLLAPGTYRIQVTAPGFETTEISNVTVDVTKVTNVNARMKLGQVTTVETVSGDFTSVDTHTATTGDVVTGTQIRDMPLPTRNFLDLTAMQAGTSARIQSAATVGRGTPILDVAGSRATVNNFVLDGVDANSFGSNSLASVPVPNPDAVGEFRVSTSMYDASQGRGSGGNINVVLRSGTAKFHGGAFEFYRSNDMNANDFFANLAGKAVPVLLQNQFGGQIGGPVPKIKDTFWFFSYQGTRQKNGVSSLISGSQPVLPAVRTAASLGAAFNVNPSLIDPVAVNILNAKGQYGGLLYPSGTCNGAAGCGIGSIGTLVLSYPTIYNEDQEALSVDRNLFKNNHIAGQYFYANIYQLAPTGGGVTLGQGQLSPAKNSHAAITDTETFTPRLLNEFRAGFTNIKSVTDGIENVNVGDIGMQKWDGALYPGIPALSVTSLLTFGGIGVNSFQHGGNTSITVGDTLSWTRGKHTIRVGIENRRYAWNVENDYGTRGSIGFPDFQSFLTGTPNRLQVDVGSFPRNYRAQDIVWFVQDDFHISRKLTLNLGLRYDYLGFPYDLNGKVGNFDPSLVSPSCLTAGGGNCVLAGFISPASLKGSSLATPGVSNTTLTNDNKTNFAPRLGAAYDVFGNGKVALRGGYGIYYIRTSGQTLLQLIASPPWVEQYLASGTAVIGSKVLANPWPAGLPQPSQFPILPVIGQFNGKYTAAGAPIFVNPDGTPAVAQSLYGFTRGLTTPYVEQYNLSVQTKLPKGWVLETGYIGSLGKSLLVEPSLNQSLLANSSTPFTYNNPLISAFSPGGVTVTQNSNTNASIRVPVPGFSPAGLNLVTNQGYSHYNGLIIEASHAFSQSFQFKMDYTFSKSTDNDSGPTGSDLDSFTGNQLAPNLGRSVSDFDQTHRFVFTGVWDLPGKKTGFLGQTIGNWRMSGVWTIQSGLPFNVTSTTGGGLAGLNGSVTIRAAPGTCSGSIKTAGSADQNINNYMNAACFSAVPNLPAGTVLNNFNPQETAGTNSYVVGGNGVAGDSGVGSLFGGLGRNILRGPGAERFDIALTKTFPLRRFLGEAGGVTFRAEAFKLFNNPIFNNPAANISVPSTFGHITSTVDGTGRILQMALKLNF